MPLSLDELLNLPPELDEDHLRRLNLLPPPAPPPSLVPEGATPTKIPALSPVTVTAEPPAAERTREAQPKLQPLTPQVSPDAVAPMKPPSYLESPQSSMMGYPSREAARRAGEDLNAPVGAGPTIPSVESGRAQVQLDRLRDEASHPWGTPENHPGFWGKVGHVLSRIGNVAGDIVAPGTMALIPGTDINRLERESALEERIGQEKGEERATAKEKSEEELRHAEAYAKQHPELQVGKTAEERTFASLLNTINPETGKNYTEDEAFRKINQEKAEAKPDTATQITQRMTASDIKLRNNPQSLTPEERDALAETQRKEAQGKIPEEIRAKISDTPVPADKKYTLGYQDPQYQKDLEKWIQSYDKALAETPQAKATEEQRRFANDIRQQMLQLARDRVAKGEDKTDLATREKVLTYFKPAQDADVRLNLMEESEKKALKGDQQAMVNLVANHVAMVLGMPRGKVPRVSHEFMEEAIQAAPILQRAEAHFDKNGYLSGIVLTPEQMRFMVDLAKQTRTQEWTTANAAADYIGVKDRPASTYKGEGGAGGGANPPQGKTTVYDPQGTPHFVLTDKLQDFLKDPKYKDWSENAPTARTNPRR